MVDAVRDHLPSLMIACRNHGVERLWLFGSASGRGLRQFDVTRSDVDLVVRFIRSPDRLLADQYLDLLDELQNLLGRPVQLLTERSIRNPYLRAAIDETKELLYAAASEKALV